MTENHRQDRKKAAGRQRERLTRGDWLEAGQAVLIAQGIRGLRLANLTRHLKVSIGSFYHHFEDMEAFLGALAEYYSRLIDGLIEEICSVERDPIERLKQLYLETETRDLLRLDAAMRNLAMIEPRAADAMARSESTIMDFMAGALVEAGFDARAARARAFAMLSIEISAMTSIPADEIRDLRRNIFVILTDPGAGQPRSDRVK